MDLDEEFDKAYGETPVSGEGSAQAGLDAEFDKLYGEPAGRGEKSPRTELDAEFDKAYGGGAAERSPAVNAGGDVVQMSREKPGPRALSATAGKEEKIEQVSPKVFLKGDTLFDSEDRTVKPGQFVTLSRKDGTSQLLSFEGASKDGRPVFSDVKDIAGAGADLAGEINIDEDDYNRMFAEGKAKKERSPLEQVRLGLVAETGDEEKYGPDAGGTARAVIDRMAPFVGRHDKDVSVEQLKHLSNIHEGKLDGYAGKTDEEKLGVAAADAGLDYIRPGESREEYSERIRAEAEEMLKKRTAAKAKAAGELESTEATVGDKIVKGGIESGGYALEFALPGGVFGKAGQTLGMGRKALRVASALGSAVPVVAAEAKSRYIENTTPEYGWKMKSLDGEPEFGMIAEPDEKSVAAYKAIGGAVFDTAVEIGLEAATMGLLRLVGKPAGMALGKLTPQAVKDWGAKNFNRFMASETGQALRQINRAYQDFTLKTGINNPGWELGEENVQAFEKVLNLDGKTSEYKGFEKEWQAFKDKQMSADTQWDIFYGLVAQLGIGAAKSTAEGVAQHVSTADARRDVRMALARSGISEETIKTLTPKQQKVLTDMWRHYSANPDELKAKVKNLGISMRSAVDELLSREGVDMARSLEQRGITPEKFVIQADADGKPAFQKMQRFTPDGKSAPMNAMIDEQHGVTIVDQGDGTFYVMNDWRGLDAIPAHSFEDAQKKADNEVMDNQRKEADNEKKMQYMEGLASDMYAGRNIETVPTEAALRWKIASALKNGETPFGITDAAQVFDADGNLKERGAGGFHTPDGTVVMILDNVASPVEMERILAHESTGHEGVESQTGRGAETVEFIRNAQAEGFGKYKEAVKAKFVRQFTASGMTDEDANAAADAFLSSDRAQKEMMANYAQGRLHQPTWYERKKHEANQRRRDAGETVPFDQADMEVMLAKAEEEGRKPGGRFTVNNADNGVRYFEPEQENQDETGHGTDEAPAQPESGAERPAEPEAPRPAEAGEAPDGAGAAEPRRMTSAEEVVATAKTPFSEVEKKALEDAADVSAIDATDETPPQTDFLSILSKDAPVVRLNPAKVDRSDAVLPNMKKDANRNSGITKPLSGEWHPTMGGIGAAWLTKDGKLVVITGRHRSELAERKGKSMLYYLYREADGFTKEDALIYDAVANIHDEKGTINDYLGFLDRINPTREQAEKAGILSGKGLVAWSLYKDATEAVRSATAMDGNPGEGQISPQQATVIAEAAPRDADKRNPSIQRQLLKTALGGMRGKAFDMYARIRAEELSKTPVNENLLAGEQMDLFSSPEDQAADILAQRQSQYRTKKSQGYQTVAQNLRAALNKDGKLELTDEYAKDLGVTDKGDKKQLEAAYEKAVERANYWENTVRLDDADKTAMDAEINAAADARAKKLAELKAKREAAKSGKPAPKTEPPAPEPAKNEPVSAPQKEETTTPPKPEKPVEGRKPTPVATQAAAEEPDPSMVERIFANTTFQGGNREAKIKAIVDTWRQIRGIVRPGEKVGIAGIYDKIGSRDAVDRALGYPDPFTGKRWDGRQEYEDNGFGEYKVTRPNEETSKAAPVRESRTTEKSSQVAKPRQPSIKMKDEAAEKIAQKQEDDLAALFDTRDLSAENENPAVNGALDHHNENASRAGSASSQPKVALNRKAKVSQGTAEIVPQPAAEVKRRIQTYRNGDINVRVNDIPTLLRDIGALFKMRYMGRSRYATYEAQIGNILFRLSDHNASGANFRRDAADKYVSVYVEGVTYQHQGTPIAYTEIRFPKESYMRNARGVANAIIDGVESLLDTGDFKVDPNIAQKIEYPAEISFDTPEFGADDQGASQLETDSKRFDDELQRQIDGKLPEGHVYQIGRPGAILRSTGVPDLPMQLSAMRLKEKSLHKRHPFALGDVKGLVKALQTPVAIFSYGDSSKAQNIIVEISSNGKNFLVGLSLNPEIGGRVLNVNSIRNVFPKDTAEWLHWIEQGKLLYADKQKVQDLIDQQRMTFADVKYLNLDRVGSILNSFVNPQAENPQSSAGVDFDTSELDANQRYLAWAKKWKLDPSKDKNQREWAEKNGVDFDTKDFDHDMFQKRVGAVAKLVKTYKDSGVADFATLATRMAERFPEKFDAMKPYLRGVWNAVADQMDLTDVSRGDAEKVYATIEAQAKEANNGRELRSGGSSRVDSDEGTGRGGDNGLRPDAGVSAAGGGAGNAGGMLAGGRVRSENPDRRVDGGRPGAVPRQPEGRADSGNAEVLQGRGGSGRETSAGNGSVGDSVRLEGSERETGRDRAGDGDNPKLRVKKAAKKAADSTKPKETAHAPEAPKPAQKATGKPQEREGAAGQGKARPSAATRPESVSGANARKALWRDASGKEREWPGFVSPEALSPKEGLVAAVRGENGGVLVGRIAKLDGENVEIVPYGAEDEAETRTFPRAAIFGVRDPAAVRDSMRNDPALRRIDAEYRAAKTDKERNALKAQFAKRVKELQREREVVNFDTPGIYTGTAADYANRSREGGKDDGPSVKKIGTGEGSQVYGWGLYGSTERGVAEGYARADRDRKRGRRTTLKSDVLLDGKPIRDNDDALETHGGAIGMLEDYGSVDAVLKNYEFFENHGKLRADERADYEWLKANRDRIALREVGDVPQHLYEQTFFADRAPGDESHLLKWYEDLPKEQVDWIAQEFAKEGFFVASFSKLKGWTVLDRASGKKLSVWDKRESGETYEAIASFLGSPQAASEFLARAGIDGVKYPVNSYGGKGVKDGDVAGWNYVSFRDDNIRVDHKWTDGVLQFDTPELTPAEAEREHAYSDWLKTWKLKDSPQHRAEWEQKHPIQKDTGRTTKENAILRADEKTRQIRTIAENLRKIDKLRARRKNSDAGSEELGKAGGDKKAAHSSEQDASSDQVEAEVDSAKIEFLTKSRKSLTITEGAVSVDEVRKLFDVLNTDADTALLADKVFPVCAALGRDFYFSNFSDEEIAEGILGTEVSGTVMYSAQGFSNPDEPAQSKAQTLLHEAIHSVTSYAIDIVNGQSKAFANIPISQELRDAVAELETVYSETERFLRRRKKTSYAQTVELPEYVQENIDNEFEFQRATKHLRMAEFIAELSNADVRNELKKHTLWSRIVNGVRKIINAFERLFGGGNSKTDRQHNALDVSYRLLDKFLRNADGKAVLAANKLIFEKGENQYLNKHGSVARTSEPTVAFSVNGVNFDTPKLSPGRQADGDSLFGGYLDELLGIAPSQNATPGRTPQNPLGQIIPPPNGSVAQSIDAEIAEDEARAARNVGKPQGIPPAPAPGSPANETLDPGYEPESLGAGVKDPVSRQEIVDKFRELFGDTVAIRGKNTTRIRQGANGHYEPNTGIIRSKDPVSLRTIPHEIGHHIDAILGIHGPMRPNAVKAELFALGKKLYGAKKPVGGYQSEGFAEVVKYYLQGNEAGLKKEVPAVYDWFVNDFGKAHPDVMEKLDALRDMIDRFQNQSGEDAVRAIRAKDPNLAERLLDGLADTIKALKPTQENWIDTGAFITKGMRASGLDQLMDWRDAMKRGDVGAMNDILENHPVLKWKLYNGKAGARAYAALANGQTDLSGTRRYTYGDLGMTTPGHAPDEKLPTFKDIFGDFTPAEMDEFENYAIARIAKEAYLDKGLEFGLTKSEVAPTLLKHANNAKFRNALDRYTHYKHGVLHLLVDAGAMSQEQYEEIVKANPIYVKIARRRESADIFRDRILKRQGKAVNRRTGSGRQVEDIFDAGLVDDERVFKAAFQADILRSLVRLGKQGEANNAAPGGALQGKLSTGANWIHEVPNAQMAVNFTAEQLRKQITDAMRNAAVAPDKAAANNMFDQLFSDGKDILTVFKQKPSDGKNGLVSLYDEDGHIHTYELPENNAEGWAKGLMGFTDGSRPNLLEQWAQIAAGAVRSGATVLNPTFALRNIVRDTLHASTVNEFGAFLPGAGTVQGVAMDLLNTNSKQIFDAMGIPMGSMLGESRLQSARRANRYLMSRNWFEAQWNKGIKKIIADFVGFSENGTRIKEFKLVRDYMLAHGASEKAADMLAGCNALDITLDFQRGGDITKRINRIIPFFNAGVQGLEQTARAFGLLRAKEWQLNASRGKRAARTVLQGAATLLMLTLLAELFNRSDDDRKRKNDELKPHEKWNYISCGDFRLPVPYEIGYVFSSIPKAVIAELYDGQKGAVAECLGMFRKTLPGVSPTDIAFVGPALNIAMNEYWHGGTIVPEHIQKSKMSYDWYDNRTSEFSKLLGKAMYKVFGDGKISSPAHIEAFLNGITGNMYGRTLGAFGGQAQLDMSRPNTWPVIGTFFRNDLTANRLVGDFYDRMIELKQKKGSGVATNDELAELKAANRLANQFSDMRKKSNEIMSDSSLSVTERNDELEKIVVKMRDLVREHNAVGQDTGKVSYDRAVADFEVAVSEYDKINNDELLDKASKDAVLESLRVSKPFLSDDVRSGIESWLKQIKRDKAQMASQRKKGATDEELRDYVSDIEAAKAEVLKLIRANR